MKTSRSLAALLFSTCFITANLPTTLVSAAHAAPITATQQGSRVLLSSVRTAVQANPALANGVGNEALLAGVKQAINQRPELTREILSAAKQIRPNLAYQIDQAALTAGNSAAVVSTPQVVTQTTAQPVVPVQTAAPASAPAAAQESSSIMSGGLAGAGALGLAGVAVGVVALSAASDGGDKDDEKTLNAIRSTEFQNQWGLAAINADRAYARGATGTGVTVAVLDSGLEVSHSDIDKNTLPNGFNFVENSPSVIDVDVDGHGTHVTGIIAAERDNNESGPNMHGVAYNSKVLPVRIIGSLGGDGDPVATTASIVSGTNYAVQQKAQVLNASYGPVYDTRDITIQTISAEESQQATAYQNAANNDVVLVFAAGNDFENNAPVAANPTGGGIYPYVKPSNANTGVYDDGGANYDFSALEDMTLAVVATTETGGIATYSNRCGVAAAWCLAAPGDNILSLDETGNGYVTMSGTSMAAPHVSGAVAVLIDMFPELTPKQIVERLLASADKTGAYANQAVYGQGFLDLEKATRPIGSLKVATGASVSNSRNFALDDSNMRLGAAFGNGLQAALVGRKLAVFDDQNATFIVDLSEFTHNADTRFDLDGALRRFRSRFGEQTIQVAEGASLSYTMVSLGKNGNTRQDPAIGDRDTVMEMAYSQNFAGVEWKMNHNINPSAMFGIHESKLANSNSMLSRDAFAAPYLSFAKQGYSMGSHMNLTDNVSIRMGMFQGHPLADELRSDKDRAESFGQVVELAYDAGALKLFSQMGMMTEKQTFLGSRSDGAFNLDSGTHTSFAGLNTAYEITPQWNLVGSYYRGVSSPEVDSRSLFSGISDVQTESFSLGVLGHSVLHEGDSLGLLGNQPLRVVGGDATLSLASGRSRSGVLYKQDYQVNLAPTGRELNLEAFYHFTLPQNGTQLMSSAMYRSEPGHIEQAPDEGIVLMQLQQQF